MSMEITEIQKSSKIAQPQKKEGVCHTKSVDTLSISPESEKKALWVDMLHQMTEVRSEKIQEALSSSPTSLDVAHALIKSND